MAARILAILSLFIVMAIVLTTAILSLQTGGHMSELAALNMVLVLGGGPIAVILLLLAVVATPFPRLPAGDAAAGSRRTPNRIALAAFSVGILACGVWYFQRWNTPPWLVLSAFGLVYGAAIYAIFKATARAS